MAAKIWRGYNLGGVESTRGQLGVKTGVRFAPSRIGLCRPIGDKGRHAQVAGRQVGR
jgi:hypothetical protein